MRLNKERLNEIKEFIPDFGGAIIQEAQLRTLPMLYAQAYSILREMLEYIEIQQQENNKGVAAKGWEDRITGETQSEGTRYTSALET